MTTTTIEIPKKQKAVIFDKPGTVSTQVVEIDVPEPGTGEVLINMCVFFVVGSCNVLTNISQDTLWCLPLRLWHHDQHRKTGVPVLNHPEHILIPPSGACSHSQPSQVRSAAMKASARSSSWAQAQNPQT
jgi:hypothetical protein